MAKRGNASDKRREATQSTRFWQSIIDGLTNLTRIVIGSGSPPDDNPDPDGPENINP